MPTVPYGSWPSPVGLDQLTAGSVRLDAPTLDGEHLYWLESRPDQAGRTSLWRRAPAGGDPAEVTPAPANVRSRVHEYGGGAYHVAGGVVVYVDFADGRLYRPDGSGPVPLTPAGQALRYGDLRVHPERGLVLAVREDHSGSGDPTNTIVAVDLAGDPDGGRVLCSGPDFCTTPELSPDGRLAWTTWDHPDMPWDATRVQVGTLTPDLRVTDVVTAAGGPGESVVQPRWLPDGRLALVSDRTGWWNLYAWADGELTALAPDEAEYAEPQWVLGQAPYAVVDADRLVATVNRAGEQTVGLLHLPSRRWTPLTAPGVGTDRVVAGAETVAAVLSHPDRPATLSLGGLAGDWTDVRRTADLTLPPNGVSVARPVRWTGEDGGTVHGWYWPPAHAEVRAPAGTLPPLVTLSHGGPTAFAEGSFALSHQFWTSRGYAVLDVNYRGSTGYGRAYRDALRGRWGVLDVADVVSGARAMGEQGLADPARLAVRGGSSGGHTVLRAVTTSAVFGAGISLYGIGDLETLATDTHKFEARYLDGLVGPYPAARDVYVERSPIHHLDRLAAPILLLQGADDRVVPPDQAHSFAAAARARGLPVALLVFDGEGHGFRRADTIRTALAAQLSFLGQVFGRPPADDLPPLEVENLG